MEVTVSVCKYRLRKQTVSCNILHKWAILREGPESNTIYPELLWPWRAGAQVRCKFRFPQKALNWPHSATAQKAAFTAGWNTTSRREQELILCLLHLVFPFYSNTGCAIICAILIVSQGSSKISKMLGEEGGIRFSCHFLAISTQIHNFAGPTLHFCELLKKNKWPCIDQPSAIQAGGDKEQHLNSLLFLSHPWEKCDCYWI